MSAMVGLRLVLHAGICHNDDICFLTSGSDVVIYKGISMKLRMAVFAVVAALLLPASMVHAGDEVKDGPAKGGAASRFANLRAKVAKENAKKELSAEEKKAKAEAERLAAEKANAVEEKAFLEKAKWERGAKRLDLGDGVHLDLIKVGKGSRAYYLGRYEVTQEQYQLVMGKNPSFYDKPDRAKHPVEKVTWHDAMEFCKLLNAAFGREMDGYVFTLPTEAQWEKAAYAHKKTAYSGSDDLAEVGWYGDNSDGHTHAVGGKKANAWGFHDMSGNVWEWCLDAKGSCRTGRGGGWSSEGDYSHVDARLNGDTAQSISDLGFRVTASRPSK